MRGVAGNPDNTTAEDAMRSPSFVLLLRACRALATPLLLSVGVLAVAYGSDVVDLDWETPALVRRGATLEAAAAASPSPASTRRPTGPQTTCSPAAETPIPDMVGAIFRCRLEAVGFAPEDVRRITAEAVTVAQCESEFDPNAVIFDGRYRDSAHPATGSRYSATGIFQFIRDRADRWIEGGYANATDPAANIDAAARVYIHNVQRGYPGWSDWACAAANDGFRATSVLPGWPGGPSQLPAWAWNH